MVAGGGVLCKNAAKKKTLARHGTVASERTKVGFVPVGFGTSRCERTNKGRLGFLVGFGSCGGEGCEQSEQTSKGWAGLCSFARTSFWLGLCTFARFARKGLLCRRGSPGQ